MPTAGRPIEILLVEDNPGDVRLTIEALRDSKVRNNLHVARDGLESLQLGRDAIDADRQLGQAVTALRVGRCGSGGVGRRANGVHGDTRQHGPRRIGDRAGDVARRFLGERGRSRGQHR